MRFTTVFSLLFASFWALLCGTPAVYAAPVPSTVVDSAGVKRWCDMSGCRIATPGSGSDAATNATSQSSDVQGLVKVLINALQKYQAGTAPSNTTVDLATPSGEGDGSEPLIDVLLGDSESTD